MLRYAAYVAAGLTAIAVFGGCTCGYAPEIFSLIASPASVPCNGLSTVTCEVGDADTMEWDLEFSWSASGGFISIEDPIGWTALWVAPDTPGTYTISVEVDDGTGTTPARETVDILVLDEYAPEIDSLTADPATLEPGGTSTITCVASDKDGDTLTYTFTSDHGMLDPIPDTGEAMWSAMEMWEVLLDPGTYTIYVEVSDGKYTTKGSVEVTVLGPNRPPEIDSVTLEPETVAPGGTCIITVYVSDPDGDTLTATWTALDAGVLQGNGNTATWKAADIIGNPLAEGIYSILITVDDGRGGKDTYHTWITVEADAGDGGCPGEGH